MSTFETIDHALIGATIDRHITERAFVVAAETVDANVPDRRVEAGKMTEATLEYRAMRQGLMGQVVLAALEKGDVGALREVVSRFMSDLTCDVLERLSEHPELGDLLPEDCFESAVTKVGGSPP